MNISSLISSLPVWEFAGYAASALVALGCAGEAVHEWKPWFKEKYPWWNRNGGKASALLLIAALATEIPIQLTTNSISSRIVGYLSRQTAGAKLETEQLKARVAWRRLTAEQCTTLTASLPRSGSIQIEFTAGDPEADIYAITFGNCLFQQLRWQVRPLEGLTMTLGIVPQEIYVGGNSPAKIEQVEDGLARAKIVYDSDIAFIQSHTAFGLTTVYPDPSNPGSLLTPPPVDVIIVIGSRPIF